VSPVRYGLVTPILTRLPGAHARWEETAGVAELAELARAADRLGYDFLTCSEHIAIPAGTAAVRGAAYWDPLPTFGYLGACTERIRFATYVLVLGYHHPLEIAKRYGTLDVVTGGRLILGVGVGSLAEEFELLGAPFADRGARADDALSALRASLSSREPAYTGAFHRYRGMVVEPHALQARVPIWIGGRTGRSLRRAVALADGWAPFGLDPGQLRVLLGRVELPAGFEVVLQPARALDPAGSPARTGELVAELAEVGATAVSVRLVHHSVGHCIEQLGALQELGAGEAP